jgi:hypothetical protein
MSISTSNGVGAALEAVRGGSTLKILYFVSILHRNDRLSHLDPNTWRSQGCNLGSLVWE